MFISVSLNLKNKFICIDVVFWFCLGFFLLSWALLCLMFSVPFPSVGCKLELSTWTVQKVWLFAQLMACMSVLSLAQCSPLVSGFAESRQQQRWLLLLESHAAPLRALVSVLCDANVALINSFLGVWVVGAAPVGFCWCWTGSCIKWVAVADLSPGSSVAVPWRCTEQPFEVRRHLHHGPAVAFPSKTC